MQIDANDYVNDAERNEQGAAYLSAASRMEQDKDLGRSFQANPHLGVDMRTFHATSPSLRNHLSRPILSLSPFFIAKKLGLKLPSEKEGDLPKVTQLLGWTDLGPP